MKRRTVLIASACLMVAGIAWAGPIPGGGRARLPDLVITQFGLSSWGKCVERQAAFTFTVTVKNQGDASWTGSSYVTAKDLKHSNWFTTVAVQPIAPGASRTLSVPIDYAPDPQIMVPGQVHPFQATVNDAHMPVESDYANNAGPGPATYMGKKVIMVELPKSCTLK